MRTLIGKQLFIFIIALMTLNGQAKSTQFVALADNYRIYYNPGEWDYALSEKTFQKSLPIIEHRSVQGLRGVFENEVRFVSKRSPASISDILKKECEKAQKFYEDNNYSVSLEGNHCIVQTAPQHGLPKSMYQVIEAKVSRSRSDMLFFYTWTFHFPQKSEQQSRAAIMTLLKEGAQKS